LTGAKEKGSFYIWASRSIPSKDWNVDRLEISVDSRPGKRILVHKSEQIDATSQSD